jgi:hypothetical protein
MNGGGVIHSADHEAGAAIGRIAVFRSRP